MGLGPQPRGSSISTFCHIVHMSKGPSVANLVIVHKFRLHSSLETNSGHLTPLQGGEFPLGVRFAMSSERFVGNTNSIRSRLTPEFTLHPCHRPNDGEAREGWTFSRSQLLQRSASPKIEFCYPKQKLIITNNFEE